MAWILSGSGQLVDKLSDWLTVGFAAEAFHVE
jgi:hypothetical protein